MPGCPQGTTYSQTCCKGGGQAQPYDPWPWARSNSGRLQKNSVVSGPPARDECPGRTLQGRASSLEECDCPDCPPPGFRPQAPRLGGGRHACDHPSLTLPESQSRSMMAANPPPSTCGTSTARGGCYLDLPGSGFPASPTSAASFPSCGSSRQSPAAQGYWAGWAGRWRH